MNRHEFIDWYEDVRVGTRRLISIVPDEAFGFRHTDNSPTIEMLMRSFGSLEEQYIRGVCTGDWGDPSSPRSGMKHNRDLFAEETDDWDFHDESEELNSVEEIIEHLDRIHDESLNIIADLTDDEFRTRRVELPWGEEGTIARVLLGLVEREIHHRTELYMSLKKFGLNISDQAIWGP